MRATRPPRTTVHLPVLPRVGASPSLPEHRSNFLTTSGRVSGKPDEQEIKGADVRDACGLNTRENDAGSTFCWYIIVLCVDRIFSPCYGLRSTRNIAGFSKGERQPPRRRTSEHRRTVQTQLNFSLLLPSPTSATASGATRSRSFHRSFVYNSTTNQNV